LRHYPQATVSLLRSSPRLHLPPAPLAAFAQAGIDSAWGLDSQKQRAIISLPLSLEADRLCDREDVTFIERPVEGRTAMAGGAECHPLGRHRTVGHFGLAGRDEPRHVDQCGLVGRLSGKRTYVKVFLS
jgi:hypothetical protein